MVKISQCTAFSVSSPTSGVSQFDRYGSRVVFNFSLSTDIVLIDRNQLNVQTKIQLDRENRKFIHKGLSLCVGLFLNLCDFKPYGFWS